MNKEAFAAAALREIPKILTLQDRNPHSPTFGCFDRNYWHYRLIDFPSGMAQEFVYPLTLAYKIDVAGNAFYWRPEVRSWAEAGIEFAARSAHRSGSCDDYFPYEQASGAAAFSLLACVEAYGLLGLQRPDLLEFFRRRADWLARHDESGRLSNHQALIVLALLRAGQLLGTREWDDLRASRLDRLLKWQSPEGWFPEYDGLDTGYQTLTLWCLARLHELRPDDRVRHAIVRSVDLLRWFVHPDGTFGGEYNSRNTYNFFPAGFELAGRWLPEALWVNDRYAAALAAGNAPCFADDHIIGHHVWNYLLAYCGWVEDRPATPEPVGRRHIKDAGMLVERAPSEAIYVALNKGGAFRYFRAGRFAASDTHLSARLRSGRRTKTAVGHLVADYDVEVAPQTIRVAGPLGWAKLTRMNSLRLILLRVGMLTVGRFFPNLVRSFLQRRLIVGRREAPLRFVRTLTRRDEGWHVRDELRAASWRDVESVGIGGDQTSIYVAMSRVFHPSQMRQWMDLTPAARKLADGEPLVIERVLGEDCARQVEWQP